MTQRNQALGAYGERVAARHLAAAGMSLLDANWRCPHGEVDLVARDGDCLVVCEVKTRSSHAFGTPIEAITAAKSARLRRLAGAWLEAHPEQRDGLSGLRIDVIGVLRPRSGPAQVTHLKAVGG